MPLYEYECPSCSRVFEIWQKISEKPKTACPDCSGPLKKLVSLSSFQLKGGGWYADGYAGKPTPATAKESQASEKKSAEGKAPEPKKAQAPGA